MSDPESRNPANSEGSEDDSEELVSPVNPFGLYERYDPAGRPRSAWGRFTAWAHDSKRWIYAIFALCLVVAFWLAMRQGDDRPQPEEIAEAYFDRFAGESRGWLYRVDEYHVPDRYLSALYGLLARNRLSGEELSEAFRDPELYDSFVRTQFATDVLALAALREGMAEGPEGRLYLENAVRNALADYYVQSKTGGEAGRLGEIPDDEVRRYFEANREAFEALGLEGDAGLAAARAGLIQQRQLRADQERALLRQQMAQELLPRLNARLRTGTE